MKGFMAMKDFMDRDFLLRTETAKHLFHDYAEPLPLLDYHCHISPKEIYENRRFDNLTEVWLGGKNPDGTYFGDHYKWRLMRSNGVSEDYVTGDRPPYERFLKFAEALELSIGNPMYHWCHLELRRFFGCDTVLNPKTAPEIWDFCNEKLRKDPALTVRGIIRQANVAMIGTTDDPTDSLEWHEKIAADPSVTVQVYPSFRPDKAVNIHREGFADYMARLAESAGMKELTTVDDVCAALTSRLEYFRKLGCRASDHGLDFVPFRPCTSEEATAVFQKAMQRQPISAAEVEQYQTYLLLHLGREYARMGIVMQLHYSCLRNANEAMFRKLGPDTGFDVMAQAACGEKIAGFLSALDGGGCCPKTVLYSLNPADNELLGTLIGAFQSDEIPGKIQHGSAWWFNDTKTGMQEQMISLANLGILGNFIGMLTDSRSFLSYARHDYFRRILCDLIGTWVENGEYPNDEESLKKIVEGVSFFNAARYFGLS